MDVYLREIINNTNSHFDLESLEITCLDLFKAGAETTSTTLLWAVLYLVRYQEVQEKCFQEISRETGEAPPSLRHNLPFCQAVIWEVQRLACVAPQTIPHRLTEQAVVEDYLIPKNSLSRSRKSLGLHEGSLSLAAPGGVPSGEIFRGKEADQTRSVRTLRSRQTSLYGGEIGPGHFVYFSHNSHQEPQTGGS